MVKTTGITTRRNFLKGSAAIATAVGFPTIIPANVLGASAPSKKLNIAGIGIGGMGGGNLRACGGENIVAICDVDHEYAAGTIGRFPKAKLYTDYRVMLDRQKDIDAVIIGTPDHTHAVISMAVMQCGKHVYTQKPLSHDVYESRRLAQAAKELKVVTQMGIQGHSDEGIRLIHEWINSGSIGEVREVDAWCSLSYVPHGHTWWSSPLSDRPAKGMAVPSHLNWDCFIGPAPMRDYHTCYHPKVWRCWWDFGCGMMGDRGAHTLDPVFWSLNLGYPTSISATVKGGNAEVHPASAIVKYEFPARENMPAVTLNWYEGQEPPRPKELERERKLPEQGGALIKGAKGTIMCGVYGQSPRLIPESAMKEFKRPAKTLPRVKGGHERNWIEACKNGGKANADFSYAGPLTEVALLGNVAKRFPNRILNWDGPNVKITNCDEANAWVRRPYRKGWSL